MNKLKEQKDLYDELWLELEPRLISPSSDRNKIYLWLFLLIVSVTAIGYWYLSSKAQELKVEDIVQSSITAPTQVGEQLVVSVDLQKKKKHKGAIKINDDVDVRSKSVVPYNTGYQNNQTVINEIPAGTSVYTNKQTPKSIFAEDGTPSTDTRSTSEPQNVSAISTQDACTIIPYVKPRLICFYRDSIDLRFQRSDVVSPESLNKFKIGFSILATKPFTKKGVSRSSYEEDLRSSLAIMTGVEMELWSSYKFSEHLGFGLGLSYNEYWERFDLDNVVTAQMEIFNPEAFAMAESFHGADQCLTTHTTQRVVNYNSFRIWSLNPQLEYQFGLGNWTAVGAIGTPIVLQQNYVGTLFDEQGLVTYSYPVFDDKRFARLGLRLNIMVNYQLGNGINLGLNLNYRQFFESEGQLFQQTRLSSFGLGMMTSYRF